MSVNVIVIVLKNSMHSMRTVAYVPLYICTHMYMYNPMILWIIAGSQASCRDWVLLGIIYKSMFSKICESDEN